MTDTNPLLVLLQATELFRFHKAELSDYLLTHSSPLIFSETDTQRKNQREAKPIRWIGLLAIEQGTSDYS